MRNRLEPLHPFRCMNPFHLPPTDVMPADSATRAGRSKETTADESMVQDLPHHVGGGIRPFLPVRHLSSYVLGYLSGSALCPMAARAKLGCHLTITHFDASRGSFDIAKDHIIAQLLRMISIPRDTNFSEVWLGDRFLQFASGRHRAKCATGQIP